MLSFEHIRAICTGTIAVGEPLARMTSYRIGGPADMLITPSDTDELVALVRYLGECGFPYMVLGNGTNILVSDDGYRGAVLTLEGPFAEVSREASFVTAGAGIRLASFVEFCVRNGLAGVEMLAGIPGTIGGGIIMNAGAYGGHLADHIVDVRILRGGEVMTLDAAQCGFGYRTSFLKNDIVLSARFDLPTGDIEDLQGKRRALIELRNSSQPTSMPSAGSVFKNPEGSHAAHLIEQAGLKGLRCGGAQVSTVHANFIVNDGAATAVDVITLINEIRSTVYCKCGIVLELEVLLIGFLSDPILPVKVEEEGGENV
jgi:UDP-N-acetylmuramate dehydrogenase